MSLIDKTTIPIPSSQVLGRALSVFYDALVNLVTPLDVTVFVRERVIPAHLLDTDRLLRVAGASDIALWKAREASFWDVNPSSAKKILTGNGRAHKEQVAAALTKYVGKHPYTTFDESDAIAVGVVFLLKGGYIDEIKDPVPE